MQVGQEIESILKDFEERHRKGDAGAWRDAKFAFVVLFEKCYHDALRLWEYNYAVYQKKSAFSKWFSPVKDPSSRSEEDKKLGLKLNDAKLPVDLKKGSAQYDFVVQQLFRLIDDFLNVGKLKEDPRYDSFSVFISFRDRINKMSPALADLEQRMKDQRTVVYNACQLVRDDTLLNEEGLCKDMKGLVLLVNEASEVALRTKAMKKTGEEEYWNTNISSVVNTELFGQEQCESHLNYFRGVVSKLREYQKCVQQSHEKAKKEGVDFEWPDLPSFSEDLPPVFSAKEYQDAQTLMSVLEKCGVDHLKDIQEKAASFKKFRASWTKIFADIEGSISRLSQTIQGCSGVDLIKYYRFLLGTVSVLERLESIFNRSDIFFSAIGNIPQKLQACFKVVEERFKKPMKTMLDHLAALVRDPTGESNKRRYNNGVPHVSVAPIEAPADSLIRKKTKEVFKVQRGLLDEMNIRLFQELPSVKTLTENSWGQYRKNLEALCKQRIAALEEQLRKLSQEGGRSQVSGGKDQDAVQTREEDLVRSKQYFDDEQHLYKAIVEIHEVFSVEMPPAYGRALEKVREARETVQKNISADQGRIDYVKDVHRNLEALLRDIKQSKVSGEYSGLVSRCAQEEKKIGSEMLEEIKLLKQCRVALDGLSVRFEQMFEKKILEALGRLVKQLNNAVYYDKIDMSVVSKTIEEIAAIHKGVAKASLFFSSEKIDEKTRACKEALLDFFESRYQAVKSLVDTISGLKSVQAIDKESQRLRAEKTQLEDLRPIAEKFTLNAQFEVWEKFFNAAESKISDCRLQRQFLDEMAKLKSFSGKNVVSLSEGQKQAYCSHLSSLNKILSGRLELQMNLRDPLNLRRDFEAIIAIIDAHPRGEEDGQDAEQAGLNNFHDSLRGSLQNGLNDQKANFYQMSAEALNKGDYDLARKRLLKLDSPVEEKFTEWSGFCVAIYDHLASTRKDDSLEHQFQFVFNLGEAQSFISTLSVKQRLAFYDNLFNALLAKERNPALSFVVNLVFLLRVSEASKDTQYSGYLGLFGRHTGIVRIDEEIKDPQGILRSVLRRLRGRSVKEDTAQAWLMRYVRHVKAVIYNEKYEWLNSAASGFYEETGELILRLGEFERIVEDLPLVTSPEAEPHLGGGEEFDESLRPGSSVIQRMYGNQ